MSETDDTDVLLLIPPNFFFVQSSGSEDSVLESSRTVVHKPSCTAQVLDKLVNQVQTLETRLESLELTTEASTLGSISRNNKTWNSTDSFDTHSIDRKYFTFPRRRRRKVVKRDKHRDLSLTSLDSNSTLGKPVPRLKLDEEFNACTKAVGSIDLQSMDGDISSIVSTPSKKNDKLLLHEIDEFLTKVEAYESPESRYKAQDSSISHDNVIKATGDYISSKLSKNDDIKLPSGRTISGNVLDKYIYLVKNNNPVPQDKPSQIGNKTLESHTKSLDQSKVLEKEEDAKSPSVRRLNFEKDVQPTSTPKKSQTYTDTFRPTSNKVLDRASKVLEQYKAQNYSRNTQPSVSDSYTMSPKREFKLPQMRPFSENKECMKFLQNKYIDSIDTDLLSLSELWGDNREKGDRSEGVKLEEERLKREHCEAMIQQLQRKILEQQEKLAVAVKVDRAKDAAIAKLRDAWLKLTGSLDKAEERHRNALDKMMREVDNFRMIADDAQKKTSHFESELYKALDLAHDYQEKCKLLACEKKATEENMEKALSTKNEIISSKDKEIETLKENYNTVMRLNKQSTDCVKNLEDVLEKEKSSHEKTRQKSNEFYNKTQSLTDEMTLISQERDLLKEKVNEERARCNILEQQLADKQNQCSELLKKCDFLDNEAKNLRRNIDLQKNELKSHYQKQLEDAVLSKLQEFQQQLDLAEKDLESEARSKENAIVDSFNKQILRIEEQHRLEVNVLEEKQREEIKLYRLQLAQASEKIGLLESKLESYRRRRGEMASQLHGVMQAQWHQALRILTNSQHHDTVASTPVPLLSELSVPRRHLSAPPPPPPPPRPDPPPPPPPAASLHNMDALTDTELHHYVKMLLSKPPNFDGSGDTIPMDPNREYNEEPTSDRPDRHDRKDKGKRLNTNKPPWKA